MGLDINLRWRGLTKEEVDALTTSDADERPVYLRSAYNEVGFEKWAETQLGGRSFYWIFGYSKENIRPINSVDPQQEGDALFPDWDASRERVEEALELARDLDNLFIIPLDVPSKDPQTFPGEEDLLDVYRKDHQELSEILATYPGGTMPPVRRGDGRFANDWVKIQAVLWSKYVKFKLGAPPEWAIRPVLVCEGMSDVNTGYIEILEQARKLIELGKEKQGWLLWSG